MTIEIQSQAVNATHAASQKISVSKAVSNDNAIKQEVDEATSKVEPQEAATKTVQPLEIPKETAKPLEMPKENIQEAVNKLQDYVDKYDRDLKFSIDDDTGRTVVKLLDSDKNVLKQYPSEDVLSLISNLEQNKGLFIGKA